MGLNVHFLTQNLAKQLSHGCSGEEVDCTTQVIPPGLQKEWLFAAGGYPGHFSFQGFSWWAVLLRKNHLGDLLGPLEIKARALSPGGLEDTALACCASAMGYLQGKLCVARVSPPLAWPQEAKLSKEHPQEGCTPGGEWNPSWREVGFASTKRRCRSSSVCGG